jgi:hypothetical protein
MNGRRQLLDGDTRTEMVFNMLINFTHLSRSIGSGPRSHHQIWPAPLSTNISIPATAPSFTSNGKPTGYVVDHATDVEMFFFVVSAHIQWICCAGHEKALSLLAVSSRKLRLHATSAGGFGNIRKTAMCATSVPFDQTFGKFRPEVYFGSIVIRPAAQDWAAAFRSAAPALFHC